MSGPGAAAITVTNGDKPVSFVCPICCAVRRLSDIVTRQLTSENVDIPFRMHDTPVYGREAITA